MESAKEPMSAPDYARLRQRVKAEAEALGPRNRQERRAAKARKRKDSPQ